MILPYSQECFYVSSVSGKEETVDSLECKNRVKRAVHLSSEEWKKLRISIQKNCQHAKCKQLIGAFDELFLLVDKGLQLAPLP